MFEARIINAHPTKVASELPLNDTETIRVYHGFHSADDALRVAKYGLSGKIRAKRIYSYEAGNNPNGLFVSISLEKAKYFADSGYIMEFQVKLSNLEAPVWAGGGGFFGTGQYAETFNKPEEREEMRMAHRLRNSTHPKNNIAQSDRPELAQTLLDDSENQALFIGDLNPNMIRAYWVNDTRIKLNRIDGDWRRISRHELQDYADGFVERDKDDRDYYTRKGKVFLPNDDFSMDALVKKYIKFSDMRDCFTKEIKKAQAGDQQALQSLSFILHPKQIQQALNWAL